MKTYQEYKVYAESIAKELERERLKVAERVLHEVRECVAEFNFTPEDVFSMRQRRRPKYYDPATGQTWSGRGREPLWIRGKDRSLFEIDHATAFANGDAQDQ
ncbi:H-NS family nucleoid-associated regulatory protein [Burkholderia cepacia]|uniref:H-NS histone family protein n=1 Tax=Burkholderia cepacia TaxID=292 RepID=UPI0009BEF231|nr:H-NS histone family protein [Burkholderia cepacia]